MGPPIELVTFIARAPPLRKTVSCCAVNVSVWSWVFDALFGQGKDEWRPGVDHREQRRSSCSGDREVIVLLHRTGRHVREAQIGGRAHRVRRAAFAAHAHAALAAHAVRRPCRSPPMPSSPPIPCQRCPHCRPSSHRRRPSACRRYHRSGCRPNHPWSRRFPSQRFQPFLRIRLFRRCRRRRRRRRRHRNPTAMIRL